MQLIMLPYIIFNIFAGLVGLIWLFFIGQWHIALLGLLSLFVSQFIIGVLLLPTLPLAPLIVYFNEKKSNSLIFIFGFITLGWTLFILSGWTLFIFDFMDNFARRHAISELACLLAGYGFALSPIQHMAKQELASGSDSAAMTTFGLSIAYILSMYQVIYLNFSSNDVVQTFSWTMIITLIISFSINYLTGKFQKY